MDTFSTADKLCLALTSLFLNPLAHGKMSLTKKIFVTLFLIGDSPTFLSAIKSLTLLIRFHPEGETGDSLHIYIYLQDTHTHIYIYIVCINLCDVSIHIQYVLYV